MDEKMSVQEYFENLISELEAKVKDGIVREDNNNEYFFEDLMRKCERLAGDLPVGAHYVEERLEEVYEWIKRQREESRERNEQCHGNPIPNTARAYAEMEQSEKMDLEDVHAITNKIMSSVQEQLEEKSSTRDFRGVRRENGFVKGFVENAQEKFGEIARIGMRFLGEEEAYQIARIVQNVLMDVEEFARLSIKQQKALEEDIQDVCNQFKRSALERVNFSDKENEVEQDLNSEQEKRDMEFEEERAEVLDRFNAGQLQTAEINGKEYYVIREPEIDQETGEFVKRGVICSKAAFVDRYVEVDNQAEEKDMYHFVGDNTETYMTLDEAKEMGIVPKNKKRDKDDKDYKSISERFL